MYRERDGTTCLQERNKETVSKKERENASLSTDDEYRWKRQRQWWGGLVITTIAVTTVGTLDHMKRGRRKEFKRLKKTENNE